MGGGGYGGRGGYGQAPMGGPPMAGMGYGAPQQSYGMPPNAYAQPYGHGYAQAAPVAYGAPPPQQGNTKNTYEARFGFADKRVGWAQPYGYPDQSQQGQVPQQPPNQGNGQGGY